MKSNEFLKKMSVYIGENNKIRLKLKGQLINAVESGKDAFQ